PPATTLILPWVIGQKLEFFAVPFSGGGSLFFPLNKGGLRGILRGATAPRWRFQAPSETAGCLGAVII
ncbi:MAG: hypothetical protein ACO4AJ_03035, partial [Prochlorothrix sp.]